MKDRYQPILEPFVLPNSTQLKNRIVMAPMTHGASNTDGSISDMEIKYYARRANGVSMVITAGTSVMPNGGLAGSAAVDSDDMIPGLNRLASTIKDHGAKAVLQIFHGGRKSLPLNGDVVSVSAIPEDKEEDILQHVLTDTEIVEIIHAFGEATRRAIEAGFDGIEIHGANGCLIQQFFSPYTNRRSDRWGGTIEKRMTFPLELIDEVKRAIRQHAKEPFIVGYRVSPEEPETPGITMADTLVFVEAIASKGLDYLHISLNDFWSVPRRGIDDSRTRLEIIQERVGSQVPVIGVGNIRTPLDTIKALQTGIPLIALGREIIMEPDWIKMIVQGREGEIKTTLSEKDQDKLVIPDSLWKFILDVPGWFPVETE
ncbi:NADH-dependent flavin oxidoreductase [Bacillus gobiensis]|uniref:NADH-dependent flavin oxidoreductase n=1 Tax=Bacillus gobiensis TaxID=1441095 RepID=UPI003D227A72